MRTSGMPRERDRDAGPNIRLSPHRIFAALCLVIAVLTVLSTVAGAALWMFKWPEGSPGYQVVKLFWLDTEHNVPTLYQFLALCFASSLLLLIAGESRFLRPADGWRWRVLGFLFLLVAIDEAVGIHEMLGVYLSLSFLPAFIYAPAVVILGLWFYPLLRSVDSRTRLLLISSGILYVGGALGFEVLSHAYAGIGSKVTPLYAAMATVEEVCEMAGIALLIYTLLGYLGCLQTDRDNS